MNKKEYINVNFSESLDIFDNHHRYPEIDSIENYNWEVGKGKNIQGQLAYAGRNFSVPERKLNIDRDESTYPRIAIEAEKNTKHTYPRRCKHGS